MNEEDLIIARDLKRRLSENSNAVEVLRLRIKSSWRRPEGSDMDVFVEVQTLDKPLKERMQDIAWEVVSTTPW